VLAWARIARLTLPSLHGIHETLVQPAAGTGGTAAVYLRHGDVRICIDVVQLAQPVHRAIPLGEVAPRTPGAAGRVIVSYLSEAEQQAPGPDGDDREQCAPAEKDVSR
jgi:DNA-binding IclR family transcriptional regulator